MKNHLFSSLLCYFLAFSSCLSYSAASSSLQQLCSSLIANNSLLHELAAKHLSAKDFKPVMVQHANKGLLIKQDRPHKTFSGSFSSFAANHDNSLFAGNHNKNINVYDIHTGAIIRTFQCESIPHLITFHPTCNILACIMHEESEIILWNVDSGEKIFHEIRERLSFASFAFHPSEKQLATGSSQGTINIWDITSGTLLNTIQSQSQSGVISLDFNRDGTILAAGGIQAIRLWDMKTRELLMTIEDIPRCGWAFAFHPQENIIATGMQDGSIKIRHIYTGEARIIEMKRDYFNIYDTIDETSHITALAFNADGSHISADLWYGNQRRIQTWDANTGSHLRKLTELGRLSRFTCRSNHAFITMRSNQAKICQWLHDYRDVLNKVEFSVEEIQFLYQAACDWHNGFEHPADLESSLLQSIFKKVPLLKSNQFFLDAFNGKTNNFIRKYHVKALIFVAAALLYAYHNFEYQDIDDMHMLFDEEANPVMHSLIRYIGGFVCVLIISWCFGE